MIPSPRPSDRSRTQAHDRSRTRGTPPSSSARAILILVACLALCLAGCTAPGVASTPTPNATATATADVWQPLRRPTHLPTLAPGSPCPVERERTVWSGAGVAIGAGPAYAAAPWVHDALPLHGTNVEGGWYYLKVLWFAPPNAAGPYLIRGQRIDSPGELGFESGADPASALHLPAGAGGSPDGWSTWATYTRAGPRLLRLSGRWPQNQRGHHLPDHAMTARAWKYTPWPRRRASRMRPPCAAPRASPRSSSNRVYWGHRAHGLRLIAPTREGPPICAC